MQPYGKDYVIPQVCVAAILLHSYLLINRSGRFLKEAPSQIFCSRRQFCSFDRQYHTDFSSLISK